MPATPTKSDLVFGGWFTDDGTFANEWNFGTNKLTSNITLYAKWTEKTYTLTFDLNGAPGTAPNAQTLIKDASIDPVLAPTWEGYTFSGWNTSADGNGEAWDLLTRQMGTQNITLYAQWVPNHYNVKFDPNGGTGTMTDEDYTFGESKALSENKYTREGYIFKGWSTVKNGALAFADNAIYTCSTASEITLYARWEAKPISDFKPNFNLNFNLNGGSGNTPDSQTIKEGKLAKKIANPTKEGYTFKGWNTIADGTGSNWDFETTIMPAHNVTLYAQWQKDENPNPTPNNDTIDQTKKADNSQTGTLSGLPKTGNTAGLIGYITILTGSLTLGLYLLNKNK